MIGLSLFLFCVGLFLSAFFSGSETGFYRASRVRLILDGVDGNLTSRILLVLANNPSLFVATTLIGNNLANYLTSLSLVLLVRSLDIGNSSFDLLASVIASPLVFVYGELLPKSLYHHAPDRLLRMTAPPFSVFTLLFSPVSVILWGLAQGVQSILGQTPLRLRRALARQELVEVFQEGEHEGVLRPHQRILTEGLFAVGRKPVGNYMVPLSRVISVAGNTEPSDVLRLARRQRLSLLPVHDSKRHLMGYVRVIDLRLTESAVLDCMLEFVSIEERVPVIVAINRLQSSQQTLATVTNKKGEIQGIVELDDLLNPLFDDELE